MVDTAFGEELKPRSILPGRQRWEIEALRDNASLAQSIERWLRTEEGILGATANPITGRLLVLHDPSFSTDAVISLIRASIELSANTPFVASGEIESSAPSIAGMVLAASGALGAIGYMAGSTLALPLAVAVGATAATALAFQRWLSRSKHLPGHAIADAGLTTSKHPALILIDYLEFQKRQLYRASAFSILARILDMVPPILIGFAVTVLIEGGSPLLASLGFASVMGQIGLITAVGSVIWLIQAGLEFLATYTWRKLAQNVQHRLRLETYAHLQKIDIEYLQEERTGELSSILNDDINRLQIFLDDGAHQLLVLVTNVVVVCPMFFLFAPAVAWVALLSVPVIAWLTFYHQEHSESGHIAVRESAGVLNSQLIDNLEGLTTIKSFSTEEFENDRIRRLSLDYKITNDRPNLLASSYTPLIRLAALGSFAGVTLFGGYQVLCGRMSPSMFASLNSFTQRILWPFTEFGQTVDKYQHAMAAFVRILALQQTPVAADSGSLSLPRTEVSGDIRIEEITFAYRDGAQVLNRVSIAVAAGETAAIVGQTGIGKTTLVKLLLRLHETREGRILLDGHDIRELRLPDLRAAIALVSQDMFLFDGSVMENVSYGSPEATTEQIMDAARVAEAHDFITALPDGYATRIGERGVKLSGGQRQRICLARAVLKDSPVLVLDEATAFLDSRTEAAIQRALKRSFGGRTTIIVTHRLTRIANADVIYVLGDGGTIVEQGRHRELLALNGAYSAMWKAQTEDDQDPEEGYHQSQQGREARPG